MILHSYVYSTAKETRKFVSLKLIKIKYVEFKKYVLHVKLNVYYIELVLHVTNIS